MKQAMQRATRLGAKGIKVSCGGRLGGAEIARSESYHEGTIPCRPSAPTSTTASPRLPRPMPHRCEGVDLQGRSPQLHPPPRYPEPARRERREGRDNRRGDRRGDRRGSGDRRDNNRRPYNNNGGERRPYDRKEGGNR